MFSSSQIFVASGLQARSNATNLNIITILKPNGMI